MDKNVNSILENVKRYELEVLDLSSCNLTIIPPIVFSFTWLKRLELRDNKISILPDEISNLVFLAELHLGTNKLNYISSQIGELIYLKFLYLNNNELTKLPETLKNNWQLKRLDLCNNSLSKFPEFLLDLHQMERIFIDNDWDDWSISIGGNPIEKHVLEILNKGISKARAYFKETKAGTAKLFEAKVLILGEGNAGKTTLAKKIISKNYSPKNQERSTEGIVVKHINYYSNYIKENFRLNIWDFGGQEIYHTTHQFFLTKRSLYLLVSDTRADDTDFNYWLQIIDLLSENSPILIIQNEKQNRTKLINETILRGKFSNLLGILKTNLWTNRGFEELLQEIKYQAIKLPHIGNELPSSWQQIRKGLEKISSRQNHISLEKFIEICDKYKLHGRKKALFLSEYLHDLGIILHFQNNPILKHTVILNPVWATQAVYKVLDNSKVVQNKGKFSMEDLRGIWKEKKYIGMHDELLELMMKFDLAYKIKNRNIFISPQLLEVNQPNYNLSHKIELNMKYSYSFMPKGIILRFIVRMYHYIEDHEKVWRSGVILKRNDTCAEVIEDYSEKTINLKAYGIEADEFLGIIQEEIDQINLEFTGLKSNKLIPCNCPMCSTNNSPHFFRIGLLKRYLEKNRMFIVCDNSLEDIEIQPLISCFPQQPIAKKLNEKNLQISRELIAEGRIIDSLNKLLTTTTGKNKDFYDQIYFFISNYNTLNADKNKGVLSNQRFLTERNKLIYGVLELIGRIEEN